ATLEGARLRFRPIVMTSLAFGFGVMPLALATGAGAGAQNAIGTGVLGGMVTATVLVLLFAPLFYVLIEKTFGKQQKQMSSEDDKSSLFSGLKSKMFNKLRKRKSAEAESADPSEVK
ncbi:MAG: efflux RND transporter permease subunit, partial [Smithellaceae bacterium]